MKSAQKCLHLILAHFALLLFSSLSSHAKTPIHSRPNILLILIDDMGWKDIGCAGSKYYLTPNIDKLASEGVQFLNAYSAAPVCTPSRGAIYSGKYPARTKLTTVFLGPAGPDDRLHDISKYRGDKHQFLEARNRHALPRSEEIFASAIADAGYTTGFFGKWHIGECPGYYPDDRGFHVAKGYRLVRGMRTGHFGNRWPDGNIGNMEDLKDNDFLPDILTDECIDFIRTNRHQPFLAVLSHYIVHGPITPRPEKVPKYEARQKTDQNSAEYAALVESVDESVGRLMDSLEELKIEKNTLVIFTSDNGGIIPTSNYPLMGGKSFPFEAGMKVPFIARWPAKIKSSVSSERIIGTDIYPTLLAAAGLDLRPQQHVDGVNLMPLLRQKKPLRKRPIIFHFPHYTHATGPFSSILDNDWKLIRFYNNADTQKSCLLYNLATDPEEQFDLASSNIPLMRKMSARLDQMLIDMNAEMPRRNSDYDGKDRGSNLRSSKALAEKEREMFEARLKNVPEPERSRSRKLTGEEET